MEKMKESFVGQIVEVALHNFVVKIILHAVAAVSFSNASVDSYNVNN